MTDESERKWDPVEGRRKFLAATGTAGAVSLAGCPLLGGESSDSAGGRVDNDGGGDNPDSDDDGNRETPGPSSSEDITVDPETNDQIPDERANFALPADGVDTTFDASIDDGATVIDSDRMDSVVDADAETHEYTIDEEELGGQLRQGDVLLLSGVALRRVSSVDRSGDEATVQTEQATLDEAIEEGTVEWDTEIGLDAAFSPEDSNREVIQNDGSSSGTASSGGSASGGTAGGGAAGGNGDERAYLTGIEMVGEDGVEPVSRADLEVGEGTLEWTYTEGDREYKIRAEVESEEQATVAVQVKQPASGDANLALTAEGTIGSMRSVASAEYSDSELRDFELQQNNVAADIELSMAAAGSKNGEIDWEFPGIMFKYVVFAGPVPVTLSFNTKLIGAITVPSAEGSATGTTAFEYRADTGFSYSGSSVDVSASVGDQPIQPDSADAAANIGNVVDLQFGTAFPRLEISVFDQVLIPYIEFGMTMGSRLTWGPVCKSSYVRLVINAGYDFEIMGVSLASDKTQLFEETERSYADDGCEGQ